MTVYRNKIIIKNLNTGVIVCKLSQIRVRQSALLAAINVQSYDNCKCEMENVQLSFEVLFSSGTYQQHCRAHLSAERSCSEEAHAGHPGHTKSNSYTTQRTHQNDKAYHYMLCNGHLFICDYSKCTHSVKIPKKTSILFIFKLNSIICVH